MKKTKSSIFLTVRDSDRSLRTIATRISKRMNGKDYASGVRYALGFTDAAQKICTAPIDYANAPLDLLRDYAVNGYDFTVRAPALAEIERRYQSAIVTEKEAQS